MPEYIKKRALLLSLVATLLFSSCTAQGNASSSDISQTTSSVTTESTSSSAESTSVTSVPVTTVSEKSAVISETTEITAVTTEAPSETTTENTTASDTSAEAATTTSQTSAETTTTTSLTTTLTVSETETEVLTETSVPAAQKPPAVINVKEVSSPGTKAENTGTAVIDYSNASLGYISAAYSGSSARAKLRIVCNGVTCDHDLSVTGEAEYFPLMQGSGDYRIQIYEQLDGKLYSSALDLSVTLTIDDDVEMYLYPNRYSMFDESSDCVQKSAEICAGMDGEIEKIAAIFTYITDNITYDNNLAATVQSGYIPDPDSVLAKKSGICFDYASLFAAMTRSQGIPARLVIGYADPDIYHAWNEVYTEETGWITPELLLSKKGYNLVDATFYAGSNNKEAIAEYISDGENYSSVYRY